MFGLPLLHFHQTESCGRDFQHGRGGGCAPSSSNFFHSSFSNRPMCQVCHKMGHTALDCHHRFNHSYQSSPPQSFSANNTTYSPSPSNPNCWFPNTAAINHFTADFSNLSLGSSPYQGTDQVCIGDGSSLPIQHSCNGILPTPHGNFLLRHLLHVPSISHNLLSVHQFCLDNNVFFEFNSSDFFVKDLRTQAVLLYGPVKEGLYVLPDDAQAVSNPSKQALIGERTSSQIWHSWLGHPSPRIIAFTIRQFQLLVTTKDTVSPCSACLHAKSHALPHPSSSTRSTQPFQLLFLDILGPTPMLSSSDFRFYLSIVDDFSKYIWFFPLRVKSDVIPIFLTFIKYVLNTFSSKIIEIQTDCGGKFRPFPKIL